MPTRITPAPGAAEAPRKPGSKAAVVGLLGLLVGFAAGYGLGRVSVGTPPPGDAPPSLSEAEQRLVGSGLLPPIISEATALNGTVVAVENGRLVIDADVSFLDPLGARGLPVRRTVITTEETAVVRLVEKTPEEFAAEQEAFGRAIAAASPDSPPPLPPTPVKEVPASAGDIQIGDIVTAEAASDILAAPSFEAVRVTIGFRPAAAP